MYMSVSVATILWPDLCKELSAEGRLLGIITHDEVYKNGRLVFRPRRACFTDRSETYMSLGRMLEEERSLSLFACEEVKTTEEGCRRKE